MSARRGSAEPPQKSEGGSLKSEARSRLQTSAFKLLAARDHEMSGRRARVHDPDAALPVVVGQAHGLRGRAWDRDGGMDARMLAVRSIHRQPHGTEFRLHAGAVLFRR